jgi:hypothetical protein
MIPPLFLNYTNNKLKNHVKKGLPEISQQRLARCAITAK